MCPIVHALVERNPRSDRDLCKKENKSPKKEIKVLKERKVLKRNKSPNRKGKTKSPNRNGKMKVQIEKRNKSPKKGDKSPKRKGT